MILMAFGFFVFTATAAAIEIERASRDDREYFPFVWVVTLSMLGILVLAVTR